MVGNCCSNTCGSETVQEWRLFMDGRFPLRYANMPANLHNEYGKPAQIFLQNGKQTGCYCYHKGQQKSMKRARNAEEADDVLVSGHSALVVQVSALQEDIVSHLSALIGECLADSSKWDTCVTSMNRDASEGLARHMCRFELKVLCDVTIPPGSSAKFEQLFVADSSYNKLIVVLDTDTWRLIRDGLHAFISQICTAVLNHNWDSKTFLPPDNKDCGQDEQYSFSSAEFFFRGVELSRAIYETTSVYKERRLT